MRRVAASASAVAYTGERGRRRLDLVPVVVAGSRGAPAAGVARRRARRATVARAPAHAAAARLRRRGAPGARRARARSPPAARSCSRRATAPSRSTTSTRLTETGAAYSAVAIRERLKILLQMAAVLTYGAALPVLKVGRIAGQFVKPRSAPTRADARRRDPGLPRPHDPRRRADRRGARARPRADARGLPPRRLDAQPRARVHQGRLRRPHAGARLEPGLRRRARRRAQRYEVLASEIERALAFMAACGIDLAATPQLHQVDVWTSHEGLLLDYEEGAHPPRLASPATGTTARRTCSGSATARAQLDGAHVEFFSGVHNPLGVKLGPERDARRGRSSSASGSTPTGSPAG